MIKDVLKKTKEYYAYFYCRIKFIYLYLDLMDSLKQFLIDLFWVVYGSFLVVFFLPWAIPIAAWIEVRNDIKRKKHSKEIQDIEKAYKDAIKNGTLK